MRKLASIQRVKNILPIPNADKIEVCLILGWSVVTKKGDFQVGDLCVFYEVDSFLDVNDSRYEFLRKSCYRKLADGTEGIRLRTICLRGQVSQGLVLPLNIFPNLKNLTEETDVTELLNVKKYEPPVPPELAGEIVGPFPAFISKTDETRIQANPSVLERHRGKTFVATEKLDGASSTFYKRQEEFGVCSRNLNLKEKEGNTFWNIAKRYNLRSKLSELGDYAIQGEVIGEGVQGNKYKMRGQDLFVFNVFDIAKSEYLNREDFKKFCDCLGLKTVPILYEIVLNHTVEELIAKSKFYSTLNPDTLAEGIVYRPLVEERDHELGRLSFKVVSPEFLLKFDT